jgi:hypothetical protein
MDPIMIINVTSTATGVDISGTHTVNPANVRGVYVDYLFTDVKVKTAHQVRNSGGHVQLGDIRDIQDDPVDHGLLTFDRIAAHDLSGTGSPINGVHATQIVSPSDFDLPQVRYDTSFSGHVVQYHVLAEVLRAIGSANGQNWSVSIPLNRKGIYDFTPWVFTGDQILRGQPQRKTVS